ncbi:hypothetical protein, partial [Aliarcobacter skirrowii]|uniref:hypothetical protein n=1 Tax=Aliarcobacter skirrowii TaxID=28200 RepID=UPI0029C0DB8E
MIVFSKTSIFAFETEIFKLNINKNNVEDEIIAIYKGYTLNDKILDIDLLKKEEFVEKFHQLVEYKIVIDNSVKQSFTLKEIKYIQNNYVNGYNYELQEIKDNGFMITIL